MKKIISFLMVIVVLYSCSNVNENIERVESKYPNGSTKEISIFKTDTSEKNKIKSIYYYQSGKKKGETSFYRGKENGKFQVWFESGNLFQEGLYENGAIYGKLVNYFDQIPQQNKIERFYKEGSLIIEKRYYKNGVKMAESDFQNGNKHVKYTFWYSNGSKEVETNDGWDGLETGWYSNNVKKSEGMLKDGNRFRVWQMWDSLGIKMPSVDYSGLKRNEGVS